MGGSGENQDQKRFLITVNVLGSAGPMKLVVKEGDEVAGVIHAALCAYARQGRLPLLGSDADSFHLYCANTGFDALSPRAKVGSEGVRTFVLCKKQKLQMGMASDSDLLSHKGINSWKSWLNHTFMFNLIDH